MTTGHVNVGTGEDITIKHLAESIAEVVGFTGEILWDTEKPNGNPRKLLDSTRANELGWSPRPLLEYGLQQTYRVVFKECITGNLMDDTVTLR